MSKIVYYFKICNLFVQTNLKISEKNVIISGNNELTPEPGRGTVRQASLSRSHCVKTSRDENIKG